LRIPYDAPTSLVGEFIELSADVTAAILLTICKGWQHATSNGKFDESSGEVVMTEHLRDGMREALKTLPWSKTFAVLAGMESRSRKAVIIPDGRTDIPILVLEIFVRQYVHDPHAIIECKRISGSDTHLCREYVVEGIDRFCTGKYGAMHARGFMVGYLISETDADSAKGINAYLTKKARNTEHLQYLEFASKVHCWSSEHPKSAAKKSIKLHHAFLGFDGE
jgi:hypothetical protein